MEREKEEAQLIFSQGKVKYFRLTISKLINSGEFTGYLLMLYDNTEQKNYENNLRSIFAAISDPLFIIDKETSSILDANDAACNLYGYSRDEMLQLKNTDISAEPKETRKATLETPRVIPIRYHKKKDGGVFPVEITLNLFELSDNKVMAASMRDITERKKAEEDIIHLSFHDHLTGLYNRRFFEEELKRLDSQRQLPLSFIMGDLNSLKIINDIFGHAAGDKILKETSEILKKVCRSDDILARWGGDEFVILLPKTTAADAEDIVQRIKKVCKKTIIHKIPVSLSLGYATKEKAVQDIQTVIIDAESNMYKNKLAQKESLTSSIIFALDAALYEKSHETKEHTDRIKDFALKLGKSIKLASHQLDELALLASLHDIGKVAIPEKILLKKSKLTEKEWETVKRHPEIGFNIAQSSVQISHIAKPILSCHENFDGSGYPLGLKGEEIPLIPRIILIVDAYDVMATGRIYKKPKSKNDAIAEFKRCAGTQFDPELVKKFIEIIAEEK